MHKEAGEWEFSLSPALLVLLDKMAPINERQYPLIAKLDALWNGEDVFESDEDFGKCRARTKDNLHKRCGNPARSRGNARVRLERFEETWDTSTAEESCALLRKFVGASHCSQWHHDAALELFDSWWETREEGEEEEFSADDLDTSSLSGLEEEDHYTVRERSPSRDAKMIRRSLSSDRSEEVAPRQVSRPSPTQDSQETRVEASTDSASVRETQSMDDPETTMVEAVANMTIDGTQSQSPSSFEKVVLIKETRITMDEIHPPATLEKAVLTQETTIAGIGAVGVRRNNSTRDTSPIHAEIYRYPSPKEMEVGVVYVLKHRTIDSLYKVGYTTQTAQQRHGQSSNCYGVDTDVVYETAGGRFGGAHKAERIAQRILQNKNLWVRRCERCGGGHREWFAAEEDVVLGAVRLAERFVQLPGYEMKDGKMRLSEAGNALMSSISFSAAKLSAVVAATRAEVIVETSSPGGQDEVVAASVAKDVVVTSVEAVAAEDAVPAADSTKAPRRGGRRSLGRKVGVFAGSLKGNFKNLGGRVLRSRENTPDAAGEEPKTAAAGREELLAGWVWAMLPSEVKASGDGPEAGKPRAFAEVMDVVKKYGKEFNEDFRAAMAEQANAKT